MRRSALLQATKVRLRPIRWLAFGAFLILLNLIHILLGWRPAPREFLHLAHVFLLVVTMVALTPIPWQWTGDDRRKAPFYRGLSQAVALNAIWLLLWPLRMIHGHPLLAANGFLVVTLLAGWIIAELQAAEGDRAEALAARSVMEATARRAQEQALKAQLDPHVLYNALSGISELIREEPAQAEAAVVSLAELYRRLTDLSRRNAVSLLEERSLLLDYLAVEQMRLGNRLRVRWVWSEELDSREVPPLLLQPLVENAIKHGLSLRKGGGDLRISASAEGLGLRFSVANNGLPLDPSWQQGTGLSNLSARLALLGGGSHLVLSRVEDWTQADLWLWPEGKP
jgi:signal transduction histidine kinase